MYTIMKPVPGPGMGPGVSSSGCFFFLLLLLLFFLFFFFFFFFFFFLLFFFFFFFFLFFSPWTKKWWFYVLGKKSTRIFRASGIGHLYNFHCSIFLRQNCTPNCIEHVCYNSRTTSPIRILMPFWSFSDNLLQVDHIVFKKCVDYFEVVHKTCLILVGVQVLIRAFYECNFERVVKIIITYLMVECVT